MPHPSPALISSSRSTTSSAPTCRTAPGRGASLPSSSYFFVGKHHVLRSKMPTGPGDVVPHCPPALVSSSRSTTSSASKCRPAPGAWCLTALQPLFLRRGAPRPPLQSAGQPRGRGASLPSSPYFFVEKHHVRLPIFPTGPGGVVLHPSLTLVPSSASTTSGSHFPDRVRGVVPHCPPALISSSRSTTSGSPFSRPAPGAWCLIPRQPLFLRPQAPRQAAQALGRLRMRPDIAKSRLFSINVY